MTNNNWVPNLFATLSDKERCAILALLTNINPHEGTEKERLLLEEYTQILDVNDNDANQNLKFWGMDEIIFDLQSLDDKQKEFLAGMVFEIIQCNEDMSDQDFVYIMSQLGRIGVREDVFATITEMI